MGKLGDLFSSKILNSWDYSVGYLVKNKIKNQTFYMTCYTYDVMICTQKKIYSALFYDK